jgi:hypothetical protein
MSRKLSNHRYEKFAQEVASGTYPRQAYVIAGYEPDSANHNGCCGLIWASFSVALGLERVPGWAAREFEIAEIGTEAKPDARADRHDHDIVCYKRRHA